MNREDTLATLVFAQALCSLVILQEIDGAAGKAGSPDPHRADAIAKLRTVVKLIEEGCIVDARRCVSYFGDIADARTS